MPFDLVVWVLIRYIRVDEKDDVQLFYYFVESERNPSDDPLLLWLTGGPSCSALSGLAFEIGSFFFGIVIGIGSLLTKCYYKIKFYKTFIFHYLINVKLNSKCWCPNKAHIRFLV